MLTVAPTDKLSPKNVSGGPVLTRPVSSGVQDYETNESLYPLTEAIPKIEALAQTSGITKIMNLSNLFQNFRPGSIHPRYASCSPPTIWYFNSCRSSPKLSN